MRQEITNLLDRNGKWELKCEELETTVQKLKDKHEKEIATML